MYETITMKNIPMKYANRRFSPNEKSYNKINNTFTNCSKLWENNG
jgi:hypothetical protein